MTRTEALFFLGEAEKAIVGIGDKAILEAGEAQTAYLAAIACSLLVLASVVMDRSGLDTP